jgi:phage tail-like protein
MTDNNYDEPLKNFRFRVLWDGAAVAGVTRVGALRRTTEVVRHTEGGDPVASRKSPGKTEYEAVILERSLTHDRAFENWAREVWGFGEERRNGRDFRKDVTLEVYNDAGELTMAYRLLRCWVSEYQGLPDLDAAATGVATETLKLEIEGWVRDTTRGRVEPVK